MMIDVLVMRLAPLFAGEGNRRHYEKTVVLHVTADSSFR